MNITLPIAILILGAIGAGLATPLAMQYQAITVHQDTMDQTMRHGSSMDKIHGMHYGKEYSNNYGTHRHEEHRYRDNNCGEIHEYMERQRSRERIKYMNIENTWFNGTVQILNPDGYIVINTNTTIRIHGLWITQENKTITYNELLNNIKTGNNISVLGHYCKYMEYVKA